MAIFGQVPRKELGTKFTHKGWFCWVCPVYIAKPDAPCPELVTRNWVPEYLFDFAEGLFDIYVIAANVFADHIFEPQFPILITGEINGAR